MPMNIIFSKHAMMFFCVVYFFLMCTFSVNCAVYSLNSKYSKRHSLHSIGPVQNNNNFQTDTGNGFDNVKTKGQDFAEVVYSRRFYRSRRNSDPSVPEIIKHKVVLNGTESSTQAYIHWVGKGNSERIFVLTCKTVYPGRSFVEHSQLWRSDDYGSSFKEVKFEPGAKITYIYPFPTNYKKLIFTDVKAKKIYITDDELNTNTSYSVDVEPDIILPHPTDEKKFLLYSISQRKLYVSVNFGVNVTLLAENVLPNFFWAEKGYDKHPDLVHMEIKGGMPLQAFYKSCIVTDCKFESYNELTEVGPFISGSLTIHKEYMFVQKSNWNGSDSYLAVSYQRNAFKRTYFPKDVKTNDFILLNLDDGQVFVAVNHGDHVNLYLSDITGQYYTLSLENVYHTIQLQWFEIDFYEVEGMNWTFIVNKKISAKSGFTSKTFISYDKGGNWAPLLVNQTCKLEEECGLQLQIFQTSFLNSVYSETNAPGIILSHGYIGISTPAASPIFFTTNNGGANWTQALVNKKPLVGVFRFNIMDQGSILTAVPDGLMSGINSSVVYYSLDQGQTWQSLEFDKEGLIVKGVLTEPGITTMVESILGHELREKPWTLIKLNFSQLLPNKCEDKDYMDWQPKDYNSVNVSSCLLGSVIHYKRRNPLTLCYNGEFYKPQTGKDICTCTPEDYECDFGYEKTGNNCKKSEWFSDNYVPRECEYNNTYLETHGYRKIPGDSCTEDSKDETQLKDCPIVAPYKLSIISEAFNVQAGQEIKFHLEQAGGSTQNTTYIWKFGDASPPEMSSGFKNSSSKKHIFNYSGHYTVTVMAENIKGNATAVANVHIQEPISNTYIVAPWAGRINMPVTLITVVASRTRLADLNNDHVHFIWSFGDEPSGSRPTLTWNSTVSHVYNTSGLYKITVEAVNSVTSVYKEILIQIFDSAEILILKFSDNLANYNFSEPLFGQLFTQRIRQQLSEDVGVNFNRLEAVLTNFDPVLVHLYIFQPTDKDDFNSSQVKAFVLEKINKGLLGVNIFGKSVSSDNVIQIISASELNSDEDSKSVNKEINLKPLFIAAPILVLALIVSAVSFMYCRKKMSNIRQYNLLNNHDDSDAMLDDDEAPLDLNVDFGIREGTRDDNLIENIGGSHLVLVTGASSENVVNC